MANAGCVLVVDDDASIREMLSEYLSSEGYRVALAEDGAAMRREIERAAPDLVLLDLKLPREDGLSLARFLRERYDVGIIMVTGAGERRRSHRRARGRCRRLRREALRTPGTARANQERAATHAVAPGRRAVARIRGDPCGFGACRLDLASHQLFGSDGANIPITSMEFDLLKVFAENPGKALSRDRILTLTKNREWDPYDRSIDIRVARLRRKVEIDPDNPQVIRTVRGVGYMFVSVA